jgi:hypothetical protein
MFKHIIIGGGISGLYIGYQLLNKGQDFLIIEKNDIEKKCYSKLCSLKSEKIKNVNDEFMIEYGASVIHSKQSNIIELSSKLGLSKDLQSVGNPKMYRYHPLFSNEEMKGYVKKIEQKLLDKLNVIPINFTVKEACKAFLTSEEYDVYKTCYPEWYEIAGQNANVFFPYLKKIGDYMYFKNGIQQLVDKLLMLLKNYIIFGSDVKSVELKDKYTIKVKGVKRLFECDKLYLSVSAMAAREIQFINVPYLLKYLELGKSVSSMRFYVSFKTPINIDYKFIVGKFACKWSIKITDKLWLITYPDGKLADHLNSYDDEKLIKLWIKEINTIFKLEILYSDVKYYTKMYWKDAFTMLNKDFYETYGDINYGTYIRSLLPSSLVVTSLPKDQGEETAWIESHLVDV